LLLLLLSRSGGDILLTLPSEDVVPRLGLVLRDDGLDVHVALVVLSLSLAPLSLTGRGVLDDDGGSACAAGDGG
jgi:hypothetical protein